MVMYSVGMRLLSGLLKQHVVVNKVDVGFVLVSGGVSEDNASVKFVGGSHGGLRE